MATTSEGTGGGGGVLLTEAELRDFLEEFRHECAVKRGNADFDFNTKLRMLRLETHFKERDASVTHKNQQNRSGQSFSPRRRDRLNAKRTYRTGPVPSPPSKAHVVSQIPPSARGARTRRGQEQSHARHEHEAREEEPKPLKAEPGPSLLRQGQQTEHDLSTQSLHPVQDASSVSRTADGRKSRERRIQRLLKPSASSKSFSYGFEDGEESRNTDDAILQKTESDAQHVAVAKSPEKKVSVPSFVLPQIVSSPVLPEEYQPSSDRVRPLLNRSGALTERSHKTLRSSERLRAALETGLHLNLATPRQLARFGTRPRILNPLPAQTFPLSAKLSQMASSAGPDPASSVQQLMGPKEKYADRGLSSMVSVTSRGILPSYVDIDDILSYREDPSSLFIPGPVPTHKPPPQPAVGPGAYDPFDPSSASAWTPRQPGLPSSLALHSHSKLGFGSPRYRNVDEEYLGHHSEDFPGPGSYDIVRADAIVRPRAVSHSMTTAADNIADKREVSAIELGDMLDKLSPGPGAYQPEISINAPAVYNANLVAFGSSSNRSSVQGTGEALRGSVRQQYLALLKTQDQDQVSEKKNTGKIQLRNVRESVEDEDHNSRVERVRANAKRIQQLKHQQTVQKLEQRKQLWDRVHSGKPQALWLRLVFARTIGQLVVARARACSMLENLQQFRRVRASRVIQRWYRRITFERRKKVLLNALNRYMMRIAVGIRIRRKRRAAVTILSALKDHPPHLNTREPPSVASILKVFNQRVITIQTFWRRMRVKNLARVQLLLHRWNKLSMSLQYRDRFMLLQQKLAHTTPYTETAGAYGNTALDVLSETDSLGSMIPPTSPRDKQSSRRLLFKQRSGNRLGQSSNALNRQSSKPGLMRQKSRGSPRPSGRSILQRSSSRAPPSPVSEQPKDAVQAYLELRAQLRTFNDPVAPEIKMRLMTALLHQHRIAFSTRLSDHALEMKRYVEKRLTSDSLANEEAKAHLDGSDLSFWTEEAKRKRLQAEFRRKHPPPHFLIATKAGGISDSELWKFVELAYKEQGAVNLRSASGAGDVHTDLSDRLESESKDRAKGYKAVAALKQIIGAANTAADFNNPAKVNTEAVKSILVSVQHLADRGLLPMNEPMGSSKSTMLHTLAWFRQTELIVWFLAFGADPNAQNLRGNTPLHLACEKAALDRGVNVITMLVRAGGDMGKPNKTDGKMPRQLVPFAYQSLVSLFIMQHAHGADNVMDTLPEASEHPQWRHVWRRVLVGEFKGVEQPDYPLGASPSQDASGEQRDVKKKRVAASGALLALARLSEQARQRM